MAREFIGQGLNWQQKSFVRKFAPTAIVALAMATIGFGTSSAFAQPRAYSASLTREQRDQLQNDLATPGLDFESSRLRRPTRPGTGTPLSAATPELVKLRPMLVEAINSASDFVVSLSEDEDARGGLRPLLVDAMQLKADLTRVARRSQKVLDHQDLVDDLSDLDAAWRELAYKAESARSISRQTRQQLVSMQELADQMGTVMTIDPQLNRGDALRKLALLDANLQNLLDDIQAEFGRTSNNAQKFLLVGGRVLQQVRTIENMLQDQTDRQTILEAYERYQDLWYPQAATLQTVENQYIEQGLRKIAYADGEVRQVLMLNQQANGTQLVYLANNLKRDIDLFFSRTQLMQLIHLPKANTALAIADQFYGSCENFVDVVNRNEGRESVIEAFRFIEDAERQFAAAYRPIDSNQSQASLRQIEQTISSVRAGLRLSREDFSRQAAIELGAQIDTLASNLDYTTRRWLSNNRVDVGRECAAEMARFTDLAGRLHEDLLRGMTATQARDATEDLYNSWRRLYNYLVQCQSAERSTLGRLASRMTPALVQLRTMLAQ
jgi:hypothetical protein